jgi:DNA repair ATPase RecN
MLPTFIEAKRKRQVIVITHNANLVVNGDAEQVIIAKFKDDKIKGNYPFMTRIKNKRNG